MTKNPHAVALGRIGGSKTSDAKKKAVRENGKKGGRPKKIKSDNDKKMPVSTFGKLTVYKAKDSEFFQDRRIGFVAKTEYGSEYYGATQNEAMKRAIEVRGADVI